MLSFNQDSSCEGEEFWNQQRSVGTFQNYLDDYLLPAVKRGDWNELEAMPLFHDKQGKPVIRFGDDQWPLSTLFGRDVFERNLNFTDKGRKLERNLVNQIKCFAIAEMFAIHIRKEALTISKNVGSLRKISGFLLGSGENDFGKVTIEMIEVWIDAGLDFSSQALHSALNSLKFAESYLPYSVNFESRISLEAIGVKPNTIEQYIVIPPRIYMGLLEAGSRNVEAIYQYKDEIEKAVRLLIENNTEIEEDIIHGLREGRRQGTFMSGKSFKRLKKELDAAGVPLADNFSDPRWMDVWDKVQPGRSGAHPISKKIQCSIGRESFIGVNDIKTYLSDLSAQCVYLCLALSGMRLDELFRISPIHGAQTFTIAGQSIHLLTTRQSKITSNSQTKNDVFVTTKVGHMAFEILNAINTPLRELFETEKGRMFGSIKRFGFGPKAVSKAGIGSYMSTWITKQLQVDLTVTSEDMMHLDISDPGQQQFSLGQAFRVTPHQLRRSLAYYLIGYELLSFPQLKQQFSHYSIAMTRWYARNSSSFERFQKEINKERVIQQADVFARIYGKLANNERIVGGKGKSRMAEIAKQGGNYFEHSVNQRKLSAAYWEAEIKGNRAHLHAIAPGMYCTNEQCSMRINIELAECVDCAFDYIEDAAYAETSRMDAMRNLLLASETNVLNRGLASKYLMQIKSAEQIMNDLSFEYEPFTIPVEVKELLTARQSRED